MKILETKDLGIEGLKSVSYAHFRDRRGYFTESFRYDDMKYVLNLEDTPIAQCNESFSKANTVRGLHFQWNPYMGKLVRTIHGHMVDIALDIRKNSSTLGKVFLYSMPSDEEQGNNIWIWVPPGFAHGGVFFCDTTIEYMCTGIYSPLCEAGISPLADDLDWSLCDENLKESVLKIIKSTDLITDKDKNGFSLQEWLDDERSDNFM